MAKINPGMRLSKESIKQLKELSDKNKRSMANMVEVLIEAEYNKIEKENEKMDNRISIKLNGEIFKTIIPERKLISYEGARNIVQNVVLDNEKLRDNKPIDPRTISLMPEHGIVLAIVWDKKYQIEFVGYNLNDYGGTELIWEKQN